MVNKMFRIDRIRAVYAAALLSLSAALAGCSGADFEAMLSREAEEATSLSPGEEPVGQVISMQDEDGGEERRFSQSSGVSGGEGLPQDAGAGEVQGFPQGAAESVSLTELPKYVFQTGDGHLLLLGDRVELMNINTLETERCLEDTGLDFSFHDFGS